MSDWPYQHVELLQDLTDELERNVDRMDIIGSLRCLAAMQERMATAATSIIEIAGAETRIPQSQLAGALGVPPGYLRGLRSKDRR